MICWLPYAILFRYLLNLLLKQRLKQGSQEAAGLSIGLFLDRKITNNDFINTVFVVKQRYKSEFFHYYKKWVSNKQTLQKAVGYVLCWLSVCVCVCMCLYSSTCCCLSAARRLWHTWDVRINDLLLWVLLGTSAKFLHIHFRVYHISPPKT